MTSNPFDIDLNDAFASAVQRREEAAKEAEQELLNTAHTLVGEIGLRVNEALNSDSDDVVPALQAILDGAGQTKTVQVEVDNPQLVEELEALRKENQELKTTNGRLERELKDAKDNPSFLQQPPPAKKAASSQPAAEQTPSPTPWERTKSFLTEKKADTSPERSAR